MEPPKGLPAIIAVFGDVHKYVDSTGVLSQEWNRAYLSTALLPFSLPLAWNPEVTVSKITCHKFMVNTFEQVFRDIQQRGLQGEVKTYGGCFTYRQQRTGAKLSTHAWGIAIDLNSATNAQGNPGDMSPDVVKIFQDAGFKWGGEFSGNSKDPMHFQFATDY